MKSRTFRRRRSPSAATTSSSKARRARVRLPRPACRRAHRGGQRLGPPGRGAAPASPDRAPRERSGERRFCGGMSPRSGGRACSGPSLRQRRRGRRSRGSASPRAGARARRRGRGGRRGTTDRPHGERKIFRRVSHLRRHAFQRTSAVPSWDSPRRLPERSGSSPAAGSWRCAARTSFPREVSTTTTSPTSRTWTSAGASGSSDGASWRNPAPSRVTGEARRGRRSASFRVGISSRRTRSPQPTRISIRSTSRR